MIFHIQCTRASVQISLESGVFLFSAFNEWSGVGEWQIEVIQIHILAKVPIPRLLNPDEQFWTKRTKGYLGAEPQPQLAGYFIVVKFQENQIYFRFIFRVYTHM